MNYKGMELVKVSEPQIFNPPKKMLVWDSYDDKIYIRDVVAIVLDNTQQLRTIAAQPDGSSGVAIWMYCAEIPEGLKPRRVTNKELAKWIAEGHGQVRHNSGYANISWCYDLDNALVSVGAEVRKWDDTGWHEPTADYLGLDG